MICPICGKIMEKVEERHDYITYRCNKCNTTTSIPKYKLKDLEIVTIDKNKFYIIGSRTKFGLSYFNGKRWVYLGEYDSKEYIKEKLLKGIRWV